MTDVRKLTQDEIDGYYRNDFVGKIMSYIREDGVEDGIPYTKTRVARFIVRKNNYNLVEIESRTSGEWNFSVSSKHMYSYRMSDVIEFLEDIYDSGAEIIALNGEIDISAQHIASEAKDE